jgi:hypothetical protein
MAMAIEFTQIHNVVRTYQLAVHLPVSVRQDDAQTRHVGERHISVPPDAGARSTVNLKDEVYRATN